MSKEMMFRYARFLSNLDWLRGKDNNYMWQIEQRLSFAENCKFFDLYSDFYNKYRVK